MLIRCPECGFERTINVAHIPSTATVATCPKCENRFRFRDPQTGHSVLEETGNAGDREDAVETQEWAVYGETTGHDGTAHGGHEENEGAPSHLPTEQEGDDPLPPGAVIPHFARDEQEAPADDGARQPKPVSEPESPGGSHWRERLAGVMEKREGAAENLEDVPWEHPEKYGFFGSMYHTVVRVLFHAPEFFRSVRGNVPLKRAAVFYVLFSFFNTLVSRLWLSGPLRELSETAVSPEAQAMAESFANTLSIPMLVLMVPFIALFQLFIQGTLYHLMVRLVQPERADFNVTLRVVAYSAAPYIFCVVPMVGTWIGTIWFAASSFVGCKYALNLSWGKAALALAPLFLLELAMMLQASAMIASMF